MTPACADLLESTGFGRGLLKSTFPTQVVLVYLQPRLRNSLLKCVSQPEIAKNSL